MRNRKSVFRSLAMVTQLGLCVLTPVLLAVAAGNWLDSRFGTKTMLPLLVLGVLGGGRGAYMTAKRLIELDAREEQAERERRREEALKGSRAAVSKPKQPSRIFRGDGQAERAGEDLPRASQEDGTGDGQAERAGEDLQRGLREDRTGDGQAERTGEDLPRASRENGTGDGTGAPAGARDGEADT